MAYGSIGSISLSDISDAFLELYKAAKTSTPYEKLRVVIGYVYAFVNVS